MSGITTSLMMLSTTGGWIVTFPNTVSGTYPGGSTLYSAALTPDGTRVVFVGDLEDATFNSASGVIYDFSKSGTMLSAYTANTRSTVTFTNGSSTISGTGLPTTAGTPIMFTTTGTIPTNFVANTRTTVTFTNGSSTISGTGLPSVAGTPVVFTTTGTLPTNFTAGTTYYVRTGSTSTAITVAATVGGAAISAGSAGSGTHTLTASQIYYVLSGATSTAITVSTTAGGTAISAGSAGSGTHTLSVPFTPIDVTTDGSSGLAFSGHNDFTNSFTFGLPQSLSSVTWQRTLSASYFISSSYDSSGNIYSCGPGSGNGAAFYVKYNSSGTAQFVKALNSANAQTYAYLNTVPSTSNMYLVFRDAATTPVVSLNYIASSGTTNTWCRTLATSRTYPAKPAVDSSANVYVAAGPISGVSIDVSKITSAGATTWSKTISLSSATYTGCVALNPAVDASGNVYVPIALYGTSTVAAIGLVKLDSTGAISWQKIITDSTGTLTSYLTSMPIDADFAYISAIIDNGTSYTPVGIKYPLDGSITGTFGNFTIAAGSFTIANQTTAWASPTGLAPTDIARTEAAGTYTYASSTTPTITLNRLF